jgi:hypothetical protein
MVLRHVAGVYCPQITPRIKPKVGRVDINIVDVEQEPATAFFGKRVQKFGFWNLILRVLAVGRNIFEHQRTFQIILRYLDIAQQTRKHRPCAGQRQQLMVLLRTVTRKTQVV